MAGRSMLLMTLAGHRCAVPAADIVRVSQAVALTPLPDVPSIAEGVIDVHGQVVPVLDLRGRFGRPRTPVDPEEHLVIALAGARTIAFRADAVLGMAELTDAELEGAELGPGLRWSGSLARDEQGLVVLYDLARVLAASEELAIDAAIAQLRDAR